MLFAGSVLLFVFLLKKDIIKPTQPPIPTQTPTPMPFELIKIFPPPGERQTPIDNLAINFTFSKPVDVSTTVIQIKPFTSFDVSLSSEGKTLSVYPLERWGYNVEYSITIEPKSLDGQGLPSPINYAFKPTQFTESPMDE